MPVDTIGEIRLGSTRLQQWIVRNKPYGVDKITAALHLVTNSRGHGAEQTHKLIGNPDVQRLFYYVQELIMAEMAQLWQSQYGSAMPGLIPKENTLVVTWFNTYLDKVIRSLLAELEQELYRLT